MNYGEYIEAFMSSVQSAAFDDHGRNCDGCRHYLVTHDMYGTGDSPTDYECIVDDLEDCPHVFSAAEELAGDLGYRLKPIKSRGW